MIRSELRPVELLHAERDTLRSHVVELERATLRGSLDSLRTRALERLLLRLVVIECELRELGCRYGQGYLVGRPMDADAAEERIASAATPRRCASTLRRGSATAPGCALANRVSPSATGTLSAFRVTSELELRRRSM